MTKEEVEKFAVFSAMSKTMDELIKSNEDTSNLYEMLKLCEGKDEYTKKFFPNGDSDFYSTIKNPPDLDKPSDGFDDISERTWLECCCQLAWNQLTDRDPKC